jgi:large subunit ribosomal protein L28e
MSDALLWELTKKQNSFLVKRNGVQLSRDPLNVANVHSFKYSGVNSKV